VGGAIDARVKIQITNIARDLSQDDLGKLFEKYGPLEECTLVLDRVTGLSKGFGFVLIKNESMAEKAVKEINGRLVNGQKIKVKALP
jgi:RNA recognition motif-containing protein